MWMKSPRRYAYFSKIVEIPSPVDLPLTLQVAAAVSKGVDILNPAFIADVLSAGGLEGVTVSGYKLDVSSGDALSASHCRPFRTCALFLQFRCIHSYLTYSCS